MKISEGRYFYQYRSEFSHKIQHDKAFVYIEPNSSRFHPEFDMDLFLVLNDAKSFIFQKITFSLEEAQLYALWLISS